ncbi:MAG: hypothetical protein KJ906_03060 [Nanoarchaeota archaeon]|nr:hypothetical protein [Nanoarchaeota archaeon]
MNNDPLMSMYTELRKTPSNIAEKEYGYILDILDKRDQPLTRNLLIELIQTVNDNPGKTGEVGYHKMDVIVDIGLEHRKIRLALLTAGSTIVNRENIYLSSLKPKERTDYENYSQGNHVGHFLNEDEICEIVALKNPSGKNRGRYSIEHSEELPEDITSVAPVVVYIEEEAPECEEASTVEDQLTTDDVVQFSEEK